MDMKKMGTALLTGVLAASLLAGCGSSQKDAGDANKPLRVATNATFVPFEFKDSDQSAEYKGFEMDLIRAVAKEMNRDVEFNNIAFSGIIPIIQQGDMDIAATGMTVTPERAQKVAFAAPFYESKLVILTPKNSGIHSAADLQGKQIAVQIGTTGLNTLKNRATMSSSSIITRKPSWNSRSVVLRQRSSINQLLIIS
mgnify:CR=1 FL=1